MPAPRPRRQPLPATGSCTGRGFPASFLALLRRSAPTAELWTPAVAGMLPARWRRQLPGTGPPALPGPRIHPRLWVTVPPGSRPRATVTASRLGAPLSFPVRLRRTCSPAGRNRPPGPAVVNGLVRLPSLPSGMGRTYPARAPASWPKRPSIRARTAEVSRALSKGLTPYQ